MTINLRMTAAILALSAAPALAGSDYAKDCGQPPARLGATPAAIDGVVQGNQFCEYLVQVTKGQNLTVSMDSDVPMEAFLYAPIERPLSDNDPVVMPEDGVYALRVAMMRAIARDNPGPQSFTLTMTISGGDGSAAILPGAPGWEDADHRMPGAHESGEDLPEGHVGGADVAVLGLSGSYEAVIPCASCPGIEVYLNLYDDGTYTRTEVYQEQDDGTFQDSGDWYLNDHLIVLHPEVDSGAESTDVEESYFIVQGDDELRMSDEAGEPAGDDYVLTRTGR